ncbi:MAG: DUF1593 domain-containing protein [Steroidobacteraceae bacterium]
MAAEPAAAAAATATAAAAASTAGAAAGFAYLETPAGEKPRVVVTTDPELDDNNSLIRYLLRSTDFRTEGLVYASSGVHWKGDGKGTLYAVPGREYDRFGLHLCPCTSYRWAAGERHIDAVVDAYAKAYPNLRVHDAAYPTPEYLRSKIHAGNVDFDGEMEHDTAGSNLIRGLLLDAEDSPVYLLAWGGQSTIARALKSIEDEYRDSPQWPRIRARVIAKAVIYPSGDQDDTYAKYIRPQWPEIRYREMSGGVSLQYDIQSTASESDAAYFGAPWMRANVSSKGPLGAQERVWGDGRQMVQGDRFDYFGLAGQTSAQLKRAGYIVWTLPHPQGGSSARATRPPTSTLSTTDCAAIAVRASAVGYPRVASGAFNIARGLPAADRARGDGPGLRPAAVAPVADPPLHRAGHATTSRRAWRGRPRRASPRPITRRASRCAVRTSSTRGPASGYACVPP